jgi:hypothetical protein
VVAVREVDVRLTWLSEHWHVSRSHTMKSMTGGIVSSPIGFNFYDSTNQCRVSSYPDKVLAEETPGYGDGASGIEGTWYNSGNLLRYSFPPASHLNLI